MSDGDHLKRLINASGYAFQLAVESLAENCSNDGFKVVAREHPWLHSEAGTGGFIDFVVEKNSVRFLVECKRTTDAEWLFLVPRHDYMAASLFDCYWCSVLEPGKRIADWDPVWLHPKHPISQFCCVRGRGEAQVAYLDNIAAGLVYASEALAAVEATLEKSAFGDRTAVYLPVVVTNATLQVAEFDPTTVDLRSGRLDTCSCEQASVVRYRKAFDPRPPRTSSARSIKEVNERSQRSIMVVNVDHFADLLGALQFVQSNWSGMPWAEAIRRHTEAQKRGKTA